MHTRKYGIVTLCGQCDLNQKTSWRSDVNSFPALDSQLDVGPTYSYEYSTRAAYGGNIAGWGPNDPLNATWWHHVTERKWPESQS